MTLLPIDDEHLGNLLPVALLGRGQFVVEDDDVAVVRLEPLADFVGLAGAQEIAGAGLAVVDQHAVHHGNAECLDQFLQLLQQVLRVRFHGRVGIRANQYGPLHHFFPRLDLKHPSSI